MSIHKKLLDMLSQLHFSKSIPLFEILQGFQLVNHYICIHLGYISINEEQHILLLSGGSFQYQLCSSAVAKQAQWHWKSSEYRAFQLTWT